MFSTQTVTTPQTAGPRPERANVWLHRYAVLVAVCTGILVFAGGLVTSTGSGLSVPDWPLSYGMVFPPMVGNVRFEHGHRMVATTVGLMTIVLAVWLQRRESRPRVRKLGWLALAAVVLQGLLGGLTVLLLLPPAVSVAHACLGQTFFCIAVAIAIFTSSGWRHAPPAVLAPTPGLSLRTAALVSTAAVFLQLVLGAFMRHTGAGLAIPDFPLAFGRLVPAFTTAGVAVHYAHRVLGVVVALCVATTAAVALRTHRDQPLLLGPAVLLPCLVVAQILLGGITVWSAKAVVPTTLHVLNGAVILSTSLMLLLRSFQLLHVESVRRAHDFGPHAVTS